MFYKQGVACLSLFQHQGPRPRQWAGCCCSEVSGWSHGSCWPGPHVCVIRLPAKLKKCMLPLHESKIMFRNICCGGADCFLFPGSHVKVKNNIEVHGELQYVPLAKQHDLLGATLVLMRLIKFQHETHTLAWTASIKIRCFQFLQNACECVNSSCMRHAISKQHKTTEDFNLGFKRQVCLTSEWRLLSNHRHQQITTQTKLSSCRVAWAQVSHDQKQSCNFPHLYIHTICTWIKMWKVFVVFEFFQQKMLFSSMFNLSGNN